MKIQSIGIIGAGIMGNGIAQICAIHGLQVTMIDIDQAAITRGTDNITKNLERLVKKETITREALEQTLKRVQGSTDYQSLKSLDFIIEAATENQGLKDKILKQVDTIVSAETIIATNTSSLSITKLAALNSRPERFIGMHFFNPVPLMSLVEVIRGLQTSDETHQAVHAFAVEIGNTRSRLKTLRAS